MIKLPRVLRIYRELLRDRRNPAKRLEALTKMGQILVPGYRFYWPNPQWWSKESFNRYLAEFGEAEGYNTQRRWALVQLLRLTVAVEGDTAECGVYTGVASKAILHANASCKRKRHHHLFDSFVGVSRPGGEDGTYWSEGDLAAGEDVVAEALKDFPHKSIYKGWIPDRFPEVADRLFCFVHVDVDLYQPTRDSVEFFYERLADGGILVCDDYGMEFCPGATRACDEVLADKREKMLSMPAGGGFFIKGVETSPDFYS